MEIQKKQATENIKIEINIFFTNLIKGAYGLEVMTSPSHGGGRRFEPG